LAFSSVSSLIAQNVEEFDRILTTEFLQTKVYKITGENITIRI
jgi:hypothetical protein